MFSLQNKWLKWSQLNTTPSTADLMPPVRVGVGQLARARARRAAAERRGGRRRRAAGGPRGRLAARGVEHQAVARHGGGTGGDQVAEDHGGWCAAAGQAVSYYGEFVAVSVETLGSNNSDEFLWSQTKY